MEIFEFTFTVDAPLQAVTDFHRHTSALKKLTPPPMIAQMKEIEPLAEGSISRFTLWLGPLPIHWKAVHSDVSQMGFTDSQAEGPAKSWVHTHTFTPISENQTRINEHIEYEHGSGFWGVMTRLLFAKPNLFIMFTYRKIITRWNLRHTKIAVVTS